MSIICYFFITNINKLLLVLFVKIMVLIFIYNFIYKRSERFNKITRKVEIIFTIMMIDSKTCIVSVNSLTDSMAKDSNLNNLVNDIIKNIKDKNKV